ncbi:efflux RND transporter periplasmic adaptor subunit [Mesonia maritima]|uniref:Cobalt-zinc-cadmium efflux system membrane fusion protein n=1 Tax=Mesonia maritima TaxID=1793873 RepID=A0ABU1K3R7_9FLAO|nr:efflux RND transporter periplasmic adaptor subunit [Mesonia maritima]MDR6300269.1 cobalt-zinc-cadmium efflux system membrane fusion protein [Mesonia maritima]
MKPIYFLFSLLILITSCEQEKKEKETPQKEEITQTEEGIKLSEKLFNALQLKVDTLTHRNMSGYVEANGRLEVPPQNEATVTTVIGANVVSIEVIEGDEVKKGEIVAYLSHPNIIELQSDYIESFNQLQFLEKEFNRQQKLHEGGVGSGMNFQKAEANYRATKGKVSGLEAKLRLLNLNANSIQLGNIQEKVALRSPIEGFVQKVEVKTGQFVQPQTNLFEIINTHHIHADLMVYEKDVHKIEKGQKIRFTVQSLANTELAAEIYSISKTFEEKPKAVHVHAEIKDKKEHLIPGMYIQGKIQTEENSQLAMPESAIVQEGDQHFIFKAEQKNSTWIFTPIEIKPTGQDGKWIAFNLLEEIAPNTKFSYNNAYYLLAESQKDEGGHHH